MKNNDIPCNVIIDLLSLYKENICSDETKDLVEEHLRSCEDCRLLCEQEILPEPQKNDTPSEAETFKKVGKKMKRGKLVRRALIFIFALIAGVNAAWFKLKFFPFKDYAFGMIEYTQDEGKLYQELNGKYYYNVEMPNYLEFFRGKLYLWKSQNYTDINVSRLMIIPRITGDTKYVVEIKDDSGAYSIGITEKLEFDASGYKVHSNDEKMKQLINDNRGEIEELMNAAQKKWGEYL